MKAVQFDPRYCPEAKGTPCTDWDTSHDLSIIDDDGKRHKIGSFKHAEWAERAGALLLELGWKPPRESK